MSQNFFNPYELVKKKGREDKDSMLEALKKKHAAKPTPMDIELPAKVKSGHTMDMEIPLTSKSGAVSAATKIGKIIRAFLARRRILRHSVGEFQKKVGDLELMLVKIPAIRNKQFLKDAKLSEMMGLAAKVWLTGFKQIFTNGVARKKVSVQQDLRNTIMALIFKLNDMIVMSFDKKTGKRSLIMYLLEEQSENVKLFISVITYLKIVKKIDTSLDYIQSASWKKSVAQFYFTLFDTEDFILSSRYINFKGSSLDLARDLHSEVIERMGCQKSFALSMYAYLKVNPADTGNMMKSYLLLIYFDHFLCRHIIKSDPSFISQHQLYSNLNYSFECCFGYPMAAKHFYKEALKHPKLHETFVDLLDHLPNGPLNAIKTVTFDSKLNFTVNMTHLLILLLQDPEPPTEV